MERLDNINLERIRSSAAAHQLSLESLFNKLNIADSTLTSLNESSSGLTYTQLNRIAKHLNRGVLYFMESGQVEESSLQSPQFRSLQNQKPELSRRVRIIIENIERYRNIYISLKENIQDNAAPFSPGQISENPEEAAIAARNWLKINPDNSFTDTRNAIENANILVFRSNGYAGQWQLPAEDDVLGFSLYFDLLPIIFVRKQDNEARQLFTLAHELGHLLLHEDHFIDGEREFSSSLITEVEANSFAGHFLVPTEFLQEIEDRLKPSSATDYSSWLDTYAKRWAVSTETILRRLLDVGRLTESEYANYKLWRSKQILSQSTGGSRQYRHREPRHLFGENFVSVVLQSLSEKKISLVTASQYLDNLKAEDVRKLEAFYEGN